MRKLLILFTLAASAACFQGCESSSNRDESNLPWSRPASWEGQAPGMGDAASPGRSGY